MMSSLDMPVTLIVKAPNQQIEDQTIQCELGWTIKKLKGYLSEVYPSKPRTDEQKLIYSGHLLHDTCTLREVLRTYEGQQQHTVHLVCAKNCIVISPTKKTETSESSSSDGLRRRTAAAASVSSSSSESSSRATAAPAPNVQAPAVVAAPSAPQVPHMWGLLPPGSPFPSFAQFPQSSAAAYPVPVYPQMAQWTQAQYAAWMQQAYAQYMAQYMHLMTAQAGGNPFQWPLASVTSADAPPPANYDPLAAGQAQAGNAERGGAEDGEDDDNPAQRDWLDWFYIISRVAVLFSVVYFYSSPMRFIVVFALGLLMYLYQIGFFRPLDDLVADNNNDPARADAAAAAAQNNNNNANNDNNNNNQAAAAPAENGPAANAQDEAENANTAAATNNADDETDGVERPSFVTLAWTFFTSFFASLIPEQPNVI